MLSRRSYTKRCCFGLDFFDTIRWEESLVVKLEYSRCCFKDDEASTTLVKLCRTETKSLSYHVPPCHSTTVFFI